MDTFLGINYPTLWFIVVGILFSGYAILDGLDFGAGAWHLFLKKEISRQIALSAVGPVWSGNEVWLVIGGGALFAGFPVAYATIFSAMYIPFMLFLITLILRAIAIEFRNREESLSWRKSWDIVYGISSILLPILLGVVLGNVLQGLPIDKELNYTGDGFLAFLNPFALMMGFTALMLVMMHGAIYLLLKSQGALFDRLYVLVRRVIVLFIISFIVTSIYAMMRLPVISMRLKSEVFLILFPIFSILSILNIPRLISLNKFRGAFLFSSLSIIFLFGLVALALFPNLLVSTLDTANNITIYNASSSVKSLKIMLTMVLIGGPLVITYTIFVYHTFRGKVDLNKNGYE